MERVHVRTSPFGHVFQSSTYFHSIPIRLQTSEKQALSNIEYVIIVSSSLCFSHKYRLVFVHSCSGLSPKLETALLKSAKRIGKSLGLRRVLIFGYNAAKLLRKGDRRFQKLSKMLLVNIKKVVGEYQDDRAVAIVAHNNAAWIVQDAIVQWQYDRNLSNALVGVLTFGLPKSLLGASWHKDDWTSYRKSLIQHVTKKLVSSKEENDMLDFETISRSTSGYKQLLTHLDRFNYRPETREVACPERIVINPRKMFASTDELIDWCSRRKI